MPLWGTILTAIFSGISTVTMLIILFRSFRFATKEDIDRLEKQMRDDINRLDKQLDVISGRIDRHLEGHS